MGDTMTENRIARITDEKISSIVTMDSREIAELTGKAHDKVTLDIETQLGAIEDVAVFREIYIDSMNRARKCYKLPYRDHARISARARFYSEAHRRAQGGVDMTTKQIAEAAGVTSETVRAKGNELFPGRFEKGKKTVFNQPEAVAIMAELRKKGFVQPTENLEAPPKNLEVVTRSDLADFGRALVGEI